VGGVPYSSADARRELLEEVARAADHLSTALADLSEAFELLDDSTAERLEDELFGPVQAAYGRIRRTHGEFARRHDLAEGTFAAAVRGAPGRGIKAFLDDAAREVQEADSTLATLQDSMVPVEVGDPELRAGLAQVRELIGSFQGRAREFGRTLGR
jgi:hypothetical protein